MDSVFGAKSYFIAEKSVRLIVVFTVAFTLAWRQRIRSIRRKYLCWSSPKLFIIPCFLLPFAFVFTNHVHSQNLTTKVNGQKNGELTEVPVAENSTQDEDWQTGQEMEFRAINAITKEPIEGVSLELQFAGKGIDFSDVEVQTTDATGKSIIKLPDLPPKSVRVYPNKPGFVPLRVYWADVPFPDLPKTITIPMSPGTPIGGTVVDEDGEPIAGVVVTTHYWGKSKGLATGADPDIRVNLCLSNYESKGVTKTDENGKWTLVEMPKDVNFDDLRIFVNHPKYFSDVLQRGYTPIPICKTPSLGLLRAQASVMQMKKGRFVRGRVFGKLKTPLAGAKIFVNNENGISSEEAAAVSKSKGEFQVSNLPPIAPGRPGGEPEKISLTVVAKGYAPELVLTNDLSEPIRVNLEPGNTVEGRVVDSDGNPVAETFVNATDWRGQRRALRLKTKTDSDGRFRFVDAPADEVKYGITKQNFMMIEDYVLKPNEENNVVLTDLLRVSGTVVDADTGRPIESFYTIQGHDYEDDRAPEWHFYMREKRLNGKYAFEFFQAWIRYRIRIEADGYMPFVSEIIRADDPKNRNVTLNVTLKKTDPLQGTVIGLDGKPLANAKVILVTGWMNFSDRGKAINDLGSRSTQTDEDGKFKLQPEVEPYCLVVVHEQGLGLVTESDMEKSTTIPIEAWNEQNKQMQIIRLPAKGQHVDFPPRVRK